MKVLWLSNVMFPEVCDELNIKPPVVGGWMYSSALALLEANPEITLCVVALYNGKDLKQINKYKIHYYLIPSEGGDQQYNKLLEPYYTIIKDDFKPDLVHIHGSEYPHALAWVKACGTEKVAVSIQGLVGKYCEFYLGGLSDHEVKNAITFRDILRRDSLFSQQKKMEQRGIYEKELLQKIIHIIGRTSWDKSNVWAINPEAKYHFCNETLRSSFYKLKWNYHNCEKQTIFLSQAHYPIKGIQQLIKALPLIIKKYPNVKVYVAGNNFLNTHFLRRNGFAKYLLKLMNEFAIIDRFVFLGVLNEEEMAQQYLKANIFVCPSAIENSPNSVGEAQLLGTPCIASYVGGTMDMIKDNESGFLYRYEETNLLAMRICEIFADQNLAERLSKNERLVAYDRHDKKKNAIALNQIYESIKHEDTSCL